MKKTVVTKTVRPSTSVKGQTMKSMYNVSEITNRTNSNLWVVYPSGSLSKGLVFSSTYTRDEVRSAMSKISGIRIQDIRSQRISTYRKSI